MAELSEQDKELFLDYMSARFQETVMFIFEKAPELIQEYDRLNGTSIFQNRLSPIEMLVDKAIKQENSEIIGFFNFVRDHILVPVMYEEVMEASN